MFFFLLNFRKMQITRLILLVLIQSLFSSAVFGDQLTILTSLRNTFRNAYPPGYPQFAVLYLHHGSLADPEPMYDVQDLCTETDRRNVIKEATEMWSQGTGPDKMIIENHPPVWPLPELLKEVCKSEHPNVATAGHNKELKQPLNAGHSEYLLLNLYLKKMLAFYKKYTEGSCPEGVFLFSYLSPCFIDVKMSSCMDTIRSAKEKVINKMCPDTPFYFGYTSVYQGKKEKWNEAKMWLQLSNINVIHVP